METSHRSQPAAERLIAKSLIRYYTSKGNVIITNHATDRIRERNLTESQIKKVLNSGWVTDVNGDIATVVKRMCYGRGKKSRTNYTVIVSIDKKNQKLVVITSYTDEPKTGPTTPIKIRCIETGEIFNGKQDADRKLGLPIGTVYKYFSKRKKSLPFDMNYNFEIIE